MRNVRRSISTIVLLTCVFTGAAFANSVQMTFTGPAGNNAGGVYTYPYNFSINGSSTTTTLICDTYDHEIYTGESWTANVSGLLSGQGLFGSQLLDYKAGALIFQSVLGGSLSANAGNFAIWGLFSQNAQNNPFFQSSGAASIEAQFLALAATAPNSAFKGFYLYTPVAGSQSTGGVPQEFIGYNPRMAAVPEPASLTLLGTGLLFVVRRYRKSAA
jgi:hypothetical protein